MRLVGLYVFGGMLTALMAAWSVSGVWAEQREKIDPKAEEFFETRVRPVLAKSCFVCHSDKLQQGGVRLDSLASMLRGKSGIPVLVPGEPEKSLLIEVIGYTGKVKMPPSGKLKPEEIEALRAWVKMGAPWPGVNVAEEAKRAAQSGEYVISEAQRRFWSFRPVKKPPLPRVTNRAWPTSPIDYFVLAKLEAKRLSPAPQADRRTLIRRAYYDLIGLPPTAEETAAFIADKSPNAFAKVVDRLLASPQYGERWARHWMDIARYADTKGYVFTEDRVYHYAYTYRDWLIRAFNEDLPYDQFILQQLAADRLPQSEDRRPLAALGFLTLGRRFLNNIHDIIDDRMDVTIRGLQGLSIGCARCHDHKYDPIPMKDYYSLYGVFASSVEPNPPPTISPKEISEPYEAHSKKLREAENEASDLVRAQIRALRDRVQKTPNDTPDEVKRVLQALRPQALPSEEQLKRLVGHFEPSAQERLRALQQAIEELKKTTPPKPEFAMAIQEAQAPVNPRVFLRGNPSNPGPEVPRAFLQILSGPKRPTYTQGSGRLEMAQAIASRSNPLTARVMVNRLWLYHFGYGLVRTPSDFGTRGEPPTHPLLLDYLAARFMEEGWSIKKMHRLIMLSSAYQQASTYYAKAFATDPENRLLWRMNRKRLDLEALRDSMLFVAGRLDTKMFGPSVDITTAPFTTRRSVYAFIERQNLPGLFRTFDFASPDTTSPQRYRTTVPQQALYLMNSPFVIEQAKHLARRPEVTGAPDDAQRIRVLYRLAYGRSPDAQEIALGLKFIQNAGAAVKTTGAPVDGGARLASSGQAPSGSADALSPWEEYAQVLLMSNEFCFID